MQSRALRSALTSLVNRIVSRRGRLTIGILALVLFVGALAFMAFAGGCGMQERSSTLEQRQREAVKGSTAAEFTREVNPTPFKVTIPQGDGKPPATVESPPPEKTTAKNENKEESESKASGTAEQSESFPFVIKLVIGVVGLAMLGGLIWLARRSSVAVNAAWNWVDDAIGSRIKTVNALRGAATDPVQIAALTAEESRLNALRAEAAK
jgi:cobalamin biosynthesis Mg chelatase CobN